MDNVPVYPRLTQMWYELKCLQDDDTATRAQIICQLGRIISELAALEYYETHSPQ